MGLAAERQRGWLSSERWPPLAGRPGARPSDVKEPDVLGVADDERPARLDVLTHEHAEQLVGGRRVVEGDQAQDPVGGIHRGLPQFLGVHLAEALVALDRILLGELAAGLLARP